MGDVADLTAKAYEIVRLIPPGHVTTYGHIAKLAGYPTYSRCEYTLGCSVHGGLRADARHVGNALKMLPAGTEIPWQVRRSFMQPNLIDISASSPRKGSSPREAIAVSGSRDNAPGWNRKASRWSRWPGRAERKST
jgi:alkylated DNA nucleotide flippase Atl1